MLACIDLEDVLLPEIWVNITEKTGIEELKLTTRDIADYEQIMLQRIKILQEHNLKLKDIINIINSLLPLKGSYDFLNWLKSEFQVIILLDTFYDFVTTLMKQLNFPKLFCPKLITKTNDKIIDYELRQEDHKTKVVNALQSLNFQVLAAGDSYNDIGMLEQANTVILFCPPDNVIEEFPQFSIANNYNEFRFNLEKIKKQLEGI